MRMYQQRGIYYVEFPGAKRRSLGTRDGRIAKGLFRDLKKEYLRGNLLNLESNSGLFLSELKTIYLEDPERTDFSPDSLRADEIALRNFIEIVGNLRLKNIKNEDIVSFKQACKAKGNGPATINTYLSRIQAALNFAEKKEFLDKVPIIKKLKTAQKPPRFIAPEDLKKIIHQADKSKPEMARIIKFALYTGARREELVKCRYEHIKDGSIRLFGKGNKERLVPLISHARELLTPQNSGKIFSYKHRSTLSNYYREITRAVNVNSRFHDLRHTAATEMLSKGVSIEAVQKVLGHSDIRMTQHYANVLQDYLKNEMKKLEN